MSNEPYTRQDLLGTPAFPPERGEWCPHCEMRIPQFAEVSEDDLARVRQLMREERTAMAAAELRAATAAPPSFAMLWVTHRGRPLPAKGLDPPLCPFCGEPLRTGLAKQCRHCKRDWHDPHAIRQLG